MGKAGVGKAGVGVIVVGMCLSNMQYHTLLAGKFTFSQTFHGVMQPKPVCLSNQYSVTLKFTARSVGSADLDLKQHQPSPSCSHSHSFAKARRYLQ